MARRSFGRSRFVRPPARTMIWLGIDIPGVAVGANAAVLMSSFSATALALRPFTIVRTHLLFQMTSDQSVASEAPIGVLGRIIVTDQAVAAGIGSIPDPVGEPDAAWFVYQPWIVELQFSTAIGF